MLGASPAQTVRCPGTVKAESSPTSSRRWAVVGITDAGHRRWDFGKRTGLQQRIELTRGGRVLGQYDFQGLGRFPVALFPQFGCPLRRRSARYHQHGPPAGSAPTESGVIDHDQHLTTLGQSIEDLTLTGLGVRRNCVVDPCSFAAQADDVMLALTDVHPAELVVPGDSPTTPRRIRLRTPTPGTGVSTRCSAASRWSRPALSASTGTRQVSRVPPQRFTRPCSRERCGGHTSGQALKPVRPNVRRPGARSARRLRRPAAPFRARCGRRPAR